MISDQEAHAALQYLVDNAPKAAQARAERIYVEEYRKSLKAQLFNRAPSGAVVARENWAYDHPDYRKHLEAIKQAVFEDTRESFLMKAHQAKVDAWRTASANQRKV